MMAGTRNDHKALKVALKRDEEILAEKQALEQKQVEQMGGVTAQQAGYSNMAEYIQARKQKERMLAERLGGAGPHYAGISMLIGRGNTLG